MLRFMFSFSTSIDSNVITGDLSSAFLLAKADKDRHIYVYPPSWFHMIDLSWDDLAKLRTSFKEMLETKGRSTMNSSCRHSGKVEQVLELDSAVYGNPAATRMFQNKNTKVITQDCGLNESKVAGALYYKVKFNSNTNRKATTIIDACILVGTHVDDLLLTGSMSMKQDFMTKYTKAMGGHVTWENPGTKFTACELKQDLKRGTFEMTQTAY